MEILELPDHKAYHTDIDKYLDEPLLEYVWIVANEFKPDCDGDGTYPSIAPVIFANRYIESKLTDEEKYDRYLEIRPEHNLEYAKDYYAKFTELNTSFKDSFFSKEEVLQTLEAFNIDLNKFWYLLLFVNDLVEDCCTNAPGREVSEIDKIDEMVKGVLDATEIITKTNGRQNYQTQDSFTIDVLKASVQHFMTTYNEILGTSGNAEECRARLEQIGLSRSFQSRVAIIYDDKVTLDKSHKTRMFALLLNYFLKEKNANREFTKKSAVKISTDKLLLISRLAHIVGIQGEEYYERYTENGDDNRKLSNLLSRYRNEPLPPMTGRIYSGWF